MSKSSTVEYGRPDRRPTFYRVLSLGWAAIWLLSIFIAAMMALEVLAADLLGSPLATTRYNVQSHFPLRVIHRTILGLIAILPVTMLLGFLWI